MFSEKSNLLFFSAKLPAAAPSEHPPALLPPFSTLLSPLPPFSTILSSSNSVPYLPPATASEVTAPLPVRETPPKRTQPYGHSRSETDRVKRTRTSAQNTVHMFQLEDEGHVSALTAFGYKQEHLSMVATSRSIIKTATALRKMHPVLIPIIGEKYAHVRLATIAKYNGASKTYEAIRRYYADFLWWKFTPDDFFAMTRHDGAAPAIETVWLHWHTLQALQFRPAQISDIASREGGCICVDAVLAYSRDLLDDTFTTDDITHIVSRPRGADILRAAWEYRRYFQEKNISVQELTSIAARNGSHLVFPLLKEHWNRLNVYLSVAQIVSIADKAHAKETLSALLQSLSTLEYHHFDGNTICDLLATTSSTKAKNLELVQIRSAVFSALELSPRQIITILRDGFCHRILADHTLDTSQCLHELQAKTPGFMKQLRNTTPTLAHCSTLFQSTDAPVMEASGHPFQP